jgi:hypothetical protein
MGTIWLAFDLMHTPLLGTLDVRSYAVDLSDHAQ